MGGLLYVYLGLCKDRDVSEKVKESALILMQSASIEHDMRLGYRLCRGGL